MDGTEGGGDAATGSWLGEATEEADGIGAAFSSRYVRDVLGVVHEGWHSPRCIGKARALGQPCCSLSRLSLEVGETRDVAAGG